MSSHTFKYSSCFSDFCIENWYVRNVVAHDIDSNRWDGLWVKTSHFRHTKSLMFAYTEMKRIYKMLSSTHHIQHYEKLKLGKTSFNSSTNEYESKEICGSVDHRKLILIESKHYDSNLIRKPTNNNKFLLLPSDVFTLSVSFWWQASRILGNYGCGFRNDVHKWSINMDLLCNSEYKFHALQSTDIKNLPQFDSLSMIDSKDFHSSSSESKSSTCIIASNWYNIQYFMHSFTLMIYSKESKSATIHNTTDGDETAWNIFGVQKSIFFRKNLSVKLFWMKNLHGNIWYCLSGI